MLFRSDRSKVWFLNGQLHREDGPACEWADGTKEWYLNNKRHREDGPAVEWVDGILKRWYLNGKCITEQEHSKRTKKTGTIEINGRCFTVEELNELIRTAK